MSTNKLSNGHKLDVWQDHKTDRRIVSHLVLGTNNSQVHGEFHYQVEAELFASAPSLLAENARLREALTDAEFLMRQAGKFPGSMQDSFNRSAEDARAALAEGGVR